MISIADMLDASSPQAQLQSLVRTAFPGEHELTILFKRRDNKALSNTDLCAIRAWSRRIDFKSLEIDWMQSPFGYRVGREDELALRYPELVPLNCDAGAASPQSKSQAQLAPLAPLTGSPLGGIVVSPKGDAVIVDIFLRGAAEDGVTVTLTLN